MEQQHYDCWSTEEKPHPWEDITDVACGYDPRLTDPKCRGCRRCREETVEAQLQAVTARG